MERPLQKGLKRNRVLASLSDEDLALLDGLISTSRGSVTINDRDGLEEAANGLYGVPESELAPRLLSRLSWLRPGWS